MKVVRQVGRDEIQLANVLVGEHYIGGKIYDNKFFVVSDTFRGLSYKIYATNGMQYGNGYLDGSVSKAKLTKWLGEMIDSKHEIVVFTTHKELFKYLSED